MEGNGYFMPLRNRRRYTPYEFDLKMSQNEDRMNRLGKIIDQDIYYTLMSNRKKTPSVSGQNYVVENNKEYKPLNQNLNSINFNIKNDNIQKNNLMEISNNSFKIPRSPRYNNSNQMRQFREPEKEIMNDEGRYGNYNPNEIYVNNMNDEQISLYPKRNNNDFNDYNMNNQYPRIMDNENTLRNGGMDHFREYSNANVNINKRYNDYEEPRVLFNNNFRSQEISKRNNIPRSPMNYEENEGNFVNNRYNNSIRERINDIDLNDMRIKNNEKNFNSSIQRKGINTINRRGFYNSQLNFPPKEEDEY